MRDKMISAMLRLALCPGSYDANCEACAKCPQQEHGADCEKMLRQESMKLLEQNQAEQDSQKSTPSFTLMNRVSEIIHEIGVPAHIKGHAYLREAIIRAVENKDIIHAIPTKLYPGVAVEFDTTASQVERAIRYAIEMAWERGDPHILTKWFGCTVSNIKGKPTNSEFIALIADKIRIEMKGVQNNA